MNKAFSNICQTGNFSVEGTVNISEIKKVRKKDGQLYAVVGKNEYHLKSRDDNADQVIRNFSDYPDEENESIYDCYEINGYLVIVLYVFSNVRRIELESETMHFYLDRSVKNQYESEIIDGDEIKFLEKEFLINKSVFIIEYRGERAIRTFEMYGYKYRANVEKERPGVFRIKKINHYKANNRADMMVQIYGHVKFVTFDDAIKIRGNDSPVMEIKTNEIFRAWQEFVGFERKIFDEDVITLGYVKYKSFRFDGDEVEFEFDKKLSDTPLFSDRVKATAQEYDIVIPDLNHFNNIEEIIEQRNAQKSSVIRLGCSLNETFNTNKLTFIIPEINFDIPKSGYIVLSDRNIHVEERRRSAVMRTIESKSNTTSNMIMRLSAGEEDSQTGSDIEPVTTEVLKKMFGTKDASVKENFREAMYIALNTPDIALIQGPPGTGKTTLINGIVARLGSMGNKNFKILISSEQHEALYNVVDKLSGNSIPPYVTSEKHSDAYKTENAERMLENIEEFQKKVLSLCNDILSENGKKDRFSDNIVSIVYHIHVIAERNYSLDSISEGLKSITNTAIAMGIWQNVKDCIEKIEAKINICGGSHEDGSPGMKFVKLKLNAQRLDKSVFYEDDGLYQLKEMQRIINKYGYNYLLADQQLIDDLTEKCDDATFQKYLEYVQKVRDEIDPQDNDFELEIKTFKQLFDELLNQVNLAAKEHKKDFYDIIEAFEYKMNDIDNVREVVKKYTNVVGSTCAQADRSKDIVDLNGNKYDYVIIDEAARANPLDLMIPVLLGIKVIMVGDQMQLPHYVENEYIRRFGHEKEKYGGYDSELLTKSLFQVLYDSLEKSWNEGKLKFRRHIRIQEQHRMHPVIGDFISRQFYEITAMGADGSIVVHGKIENGEKTVLNVNDYGVFDGKNAVWVDVPITEGLEERESTKIFRIPEAEKVVETIQEIVRKNPDRDVRIGVVSFYKGQVEIMNSLLSERFPDTVLKNIQCNTVDSYQGKEFDIVLLSTTRCNREPDIGKSLGFIHYSKSRINVALSRARRLLIVVGDSETMVHNEVFRNYINYVKTI